MDIYHVWCDLKAGERDTAFVDHLKTYLAHLQSEGLIAGHRITRRKLGLGPADLGEFHIMLETETLEQLDAAFRAVGSRADPIEKLHHAVNSCVSKIRFALYRDFPDEFRQRGGERF